MLIAKIKQLPAESGNTPALARGGNADSGVAAVHPAVWVTVGACLLAAIGLTLVQQLVPAFVCGLVRWLPES